MKTTQRIKKATMKTLKLNLAKKLLILNHENKEDMDASWDHTSAFGKQTNKINGSLVKPLYKGTFLMEENYRSLIADEDGGISISKHPSAYKISYSRHKNAFVDIIEKEGFYWLENPIEEPTMSKYGWYASGNPEEDSGWMYEEGEEKYYEALKEFEEAESRTLRFPIIFEILEE